jgi:predicted TIM-barrel enzyme
VMFPIDNWSSSLKVPLLTVCVFFPPAAVIATGRRTGSRIMPHKTRILNTGSEHGEK